MSYRKQPHSTLRQQVQSTSLYSKQGPLVNVIVPVYNVEQYLKQCLESLINQIYQDIRIILIDDGSTDGCSQICDNYAIQDSRIVVFHQQNKGLSAARNVGLDFIFSLDQKDQGEYVAFVDSDDWINPDYIFFLLNLIVENNADIAQCGHYIAYSNTHEEDKNRIHNTQILTCIEALESLCRNGIWDVTTWNKLYKLKLFSNVRFPEGKSYEDTATCYLLAAQCNRFVVNMTPKYHYVQRYTSIANGKGWKDSKFDLVSAGDEMACWIQKHYPQLCDAAIEKRVFVRLSTLAQMANTGYTDFTYIYEMRRYIVKNARVVLCDAKASKRDKLGILALLCGYSCYKFIWRVYYAIKRRR